MRTNFTKRLILPFVLLTIMVVVGSCNVTNLSNKPIEFNESSDMGLVVGSVTFLDVKPRFVAYFPYLHAIEGGKSTEFTIEPEMEREIRHAGELNNGKTYLFAIERAPGKYEINQIRCSSTGYEDEKRYDKAEGFSIPFEVKKGEIVYVGEILFDEYATNEASLVNLQSNFKRDIQGLKLKQPSVDWSKAKRASLEINRTEQIK